MGFIMFIRLIIAIIVAVIVSGFYKGYTAETGSLYQLDLVTIGCFLIATLVSVILGTVLQPGKREGSGFSSAFSSDASREQGTVKWFNVSKGFGFITRANGEDIFVHYRSIRGKGRRRLFDGQTVEFAVIDSDKGLQADDVEVIR